jgi:serine/threonine protein kinase
MLTEEEDAEDLKARCNFIIGDVFMVFEYVDYDLAGLMASTDVNFTPAHVQSFMKQLLTGVHFMHKNNILHRDLKGANILITKDNCLKIADWGLARSFINRSQRFSDKVVTLWYRSPELLLESRSYSSEVDMWSVGCVS